MSNCSLITKFYYSPNHSGKRTHAIDRITPHCTAGRMTGAGIGACFASPARQASCNIGIGESGEVVGIVDEANRSWCSSSNANDQRAVTIECSSDSWAPYAMNSKVYKSLVSVCADICKRHKKKKLIWIPDKNKALNYSPAAGEMLLTVHRWFANKSCPGDWLYSRMSTLAADVNKLLGSSGSSESFRVEIVTKRLHVRAKARKASKHVMYVYKGGVYTIVQTNAKGTWGKLKSGVGWISLSKKYVRRM